METNRFYSARELAEAVGCSRKALRVYQQNGLLGPARSRGSQRYDSEAFHRLRLVVALRSIDMSIRDIKALIDVYDRERTAGPVAARLAREVTELVRQTSERIEELMRVRQRFVTARETLIECSDCSKAVSACAECAHSGRLDSATRVLLAGLGAPSGAEA